MSDTPLVQGQGTPEYFAYLLMKDIMDRAPAPSQDEYRQYVLQLYAECLKTVRQPNSCLEQKDKF